MGWLLDDVDRVDEDRHGFQLGIDIDMVSNWGFYHWGLPRIGDLPAGNDRLIGDDGWFYDSIHGFFIGDSIASVANDSIPEGNHWYDL